MTDAGLIFPPEPNYCVEAAADMMLVSMGIQRLTAEYQTWYNYADQYQKATDGYIRSVVSNIQEYLKSQPYLEQISFRCFEGYDRDAHWTCLNEAPVIKLSEIGRELVEDAEDRMNWEYEFDMEDPPDSHPVLDELSEQWYEEITKISAPLHSFTEALTGAYGQDIQLNITRDDVSTDHYSSG